MQPDAETGVESGSTGGFICLKNIVADILGKSFYLAMSSNGLGVRVRTKGTFVSRCAFVAFIEKVLCFP